MVDSGNYSQTSSTKSKKPKSNTNIKQQYSQLLKKEIYNHIKQSKTTVDEGGGMDEAFPFVNQSGTQTATKLKDVLSPSKTWYDYLKDQLK